MREGVQPGCERAHAFSSDFTFCTLRLCMMCVGGGAKMVNFGLNTAKSTTQCARREQRVTPDTTTYLLRNGSFEHAIRSLSKSTHTTACRREEERVSENETCERKAETRANARKKLSNRGQHVSVPQDKVRKCAHRSTHIGYTLVIKTCHP